jgi:hypothetical protein
MALGLTFSASSGAGCSYRQAPAVWLHGQRYPAEDVHRVPDISRLTARLTVYSRSPSCLPSQGHGKVSHRLSTALRKSPTCLDANVSGRTANAAKMLAVQWIGERQEGLPVPRVKGKRSSVEIGSCDWPLREHRVSSNLVEADRTLQCGDKFALAARIRAKVSDKVWIATWIALDTEDMGEILERSLCAVEKRDIPRLRVRMTRPRKLLMDPQGFCGVDLGTGDP